MDKKCHLLIKIGNIFKKCYLQHNNKNKVLVLDDLTGKYTVTINPTPSDAVVRFYTSSGETISNTIAVPFGTSVRYKVSKRRFEPEENTITVTDNVTLNIELEPVYHELDIVDYEYTNINSYLKLTKYIGSGTDVVVPNIEED